MTGEEHKGTTTVNQPPAQPTKDIAERLARKYNKRGVIIIHLDEIHIGYASYGATKKECEVVKVLADECMALITRRMK